MTLEEYTKAGDPDSFMNWVEFRTKPLATISGTSSFIFGIYSRKDQTAKSNTKNNIYEDQYAWRVAYGRTKESAFQHVKTQILAVIKAIQNNDLHKIEEIDLIKTVKWKIAFLYQDRNNLKIIPTFAEQRLRYLTGVGLKDKDFTIEKAYQQLISEKGDQDLFDFNSALTQKYLEANPKDKFNTQIAYDYMHERYPEFEKNTEYL
ncbi:restriction endonuclease, partial [Acinetobacter baumannii]